MHQRSLLHWHWVISPTQACCRGNMQRPGVIQFTGSPKACLQGTGEHIMRKSAAGQQQLDNCMVEHLGQLGNKAACTKQLNVSPRTPCITQNSMPLPACQYPGLRCQETSHLASLLAAGWQLKWSCCSLTSRPHSHLALPTAAHASLRSVDDPPSPPPTGSHSGAIQGVC